MTTVVARRLVLPPQEVAGMCARLGLSLPVAFGCSPAPVDEVHPAVAAGLATTCAPTVGVHVSSTYGEAALGVRADLGAGLIRAETSDVEVSAWPAVRLGDELARAVADLGSSERPDLHLPLDDVPTALRGTAIGFLRATVLAPPQVVGVVVWVATRAGWLALEPAEVRRGARWARVRPVVPADLASCLAPLVAAALA